MSQIHVRANPGDIAPYVLLPGDPNRARWIAETYLQDPVLYTDHRGLLGFTGTYQGVRVSVQTTGMGCPSAAIVAEEIIRLGATHLIRVGTIGGATPRLKPADLVIAQAAVPNDGTTRQLLGGAPYAPCASYAIVEAAVSAARDADVPHHVGLVMTEDAFYASTPEHARSWAARGVLGFEMEASAIFLVAALHGVHAGCLTAVSNDIGDPQLVPDEVLKRGVQLMTETALNAIVRLDRNH
ncbi:purine-nucleoside phosphorylase [Deinococcus maricopensis]|uniref:Uridine phosphorylase n=1 Tax=Deinococcus maricopensis (strain DSM 21211 / LMG 22137 / NRRL B-23946 / LB-34) TaxID=709986 RepID=E8U8N3_DEIML|nr:purine-nucleoside phosphorylase [Deinococcus maricopensis]ADV67422.1 Purine-nucleoside phosphorylase [Deinococcus maricopensis DSM 21211]